MVKMVEASFDGYYIYNDIQTTQTILSIPVTGVHDGYWNGMAEVLITTFATDPSSVGGAIREIFEVRITPDLNGDGYIDVTATAAGAAIDINSMLGSFALNPSNLSTEEGFENCGLDGFNSTFNVDVNFAQTVPDKTRLITFVTIRAATPYG